ncbi:MAG: ABC transporter ATP-binding protein [Thermonemataceae bacterium]
MLLKIDNLKKHYTTEEVETLALNGVTLQVTEGEFVAIMGPSGCGKSTLLNLIGLLDTPSAGSIHFLEKEVTRTSEKKRAEIRKRNIGFIFQSFNLIDELTVFENIELPLAYLKISSKQRKRQVEALMEQLRIKHRRDHFPQQLSGGQQQKVAIARAIITNPKLILADEPTGNLDSKNGEDVMYLLTQLNKQGTTILMVTHSTYDAAYAQRAVYLLDGTIVSEQALTQSKRS